jgi:hypothetical protein
MPLDIIAYLCANIETWIAPEPPTPGNIFAEDQAATPDRTATVYQLPGGKIQRTFKNIAWEAPRLRIVNRATTLDWATAEADATAIWKLLSVVVNTTLNGVFYMILDPTGSPAKAELDPNNRPLWAQEYSVMKYVSS